MSKTRKYIIFMLIFSFLLMLLTKLSRLCFWAMALENAPHKIKEE